MREVQISHAFVGVPLMRLGPILEVDQWRSVFEAGLLGTMRWVFLLPPPNAVASPSPRMALDWKRPPISSPAGVSFFFGLGDAVEVHPSAN